LSRGFLWHNHVIHLMARDDIRYYNRSLENHFSLGCKCKQLLFPLNLESLRFIIGCSILGMEFQVKPPTFGLPMSSQSVVLAIAPAWANLSSRVTTIASLMTPFLATKINYVILFWFLMMLASLVSWSPRVGAYLDGIIISLMPSSKPLQAYLSGLLHSPFLASFSSLGMASFMVPLALTKVVCDALMLASCPLNPRYSCLGLY
jgi:hypothetical protein